MKTAFRWYVLLISVLLCACEYSSKEPNSSIISAEELAERIQTDSAPLILDVRSPEEYAKGHIPNAINIPHNELTSRIAEISVGKSTEIVVHCHAGPRAQLAESILLKHNYTKVRDLKGHWQAWKASKHPIE